MAREIGFWSRLCEPLSGGGCHPHIVPLLGHGPRDKAGFVHLGMDYCAGGHLWQEVERRQRQAGGAAAGGAAGGAFFSEKEAAGVVADVSAALAHMHGLSPPLSHRDIKLENILLADGGAWRLCDFGSCSERCEANSELCLPWLYLLPTACYLPPTTYTYYLLPTTYYLYLPPATYYLLPTTIGAASSQSCHGRRCLRSKPRWSGSPPPCTEHPSWRTSTRGRWWGRRWPPCAHHAHTMRTHMQHAHATCTCDMHMRHAHATCTCARHAHAHATC